MGKGYYQKKVRMNLLQLGMLEQNLGNRVSITLQGNEVIEGTLLNFDQFTVLMKEKGKRKHTLIFKQAILIIRDLEYDEEFKVDESRQDS